MEWRSANSQRPDEYMGPTENQRISNTLHRIFLLLYVQFVYYWATIAAGMFVNYYYAVPGSTQPDVGSILFQIFSAPPLFVHVLFAVLSTGMSIPIIIMARSVRLKNVIRLHLGAMTFRTVGFVFGPLFVYFSTSTIGNGPMASIATFIMATVFIMAVILTFLSRIFIVREDVRVKSSAVAQPLAPITAVER